MKWTDKKDLEALRKSNLFDEKYYLEQYHDVTILNMDPLQHYSWIGHKIKRNPSANFHTANYLKLYPDVERAGIDPLYHYVRWGKNEGRIPGIIGNKISDSFSNKSSYINRGPFKIKRSYHVFDESRQERFFNFVRNTYQQGPKKFDDVLVTVIMPTYNRAAEIGRAIESVIAQSHRNWQLIVIDDGSDDDTRDALESFKFDERIECVFLNHEGVSAARNAGLARANGTYVAYLDSDNTWNEKFLLSMIVFMETQTLDAAYSGIRAINDEGKTVCYRGDVFVWSVCSYSNYIDINAFIHRRCPSFFIDEACIFDISLKRLVDWDFILRFTAESEVAYAPFIGVNYYDGDSGGRITRTEYQNGELPSIVDFIRTKHFHRDPQHEVLDTGVGIKLSSQEVRNKITGQRKIIYFPDYTQTNSYQNLLYSNFQDFDVSKGSIDECISLAMNNERGDTDVVVFHVHWLGPVFGSANCEQEAITLVNRFLAKCRLFIALNGQLMWTVHNIISHEPKYLEQEIRLCQELALMAGLVHVHDLATIELTKGYYKIPPEKIVVAEHGNYIGSLPDDLTREQARSSLGIPQEHSVFLFLGQIRGYKGVDDLVQAFALIQNGCSDRWLVLAGKLLGVDQSALEQKLRSIPNVIFRPGFVPDQEMQIYLRSADVMVLPYRSVLTSGSVFLALSFGLPVICTSTGLLGQVVRDGDNGLLYPAGNVDALADAMRRFLDGGRTTGERMSSSALATAKSFRWEDTSAKLRRCIEGIGFGEIVRTELRNVARTWFVRWPKERLEDRRCIAIVLHYQNIEDTRGCLQSLSDQDVEIGIVLISNAESLHDIQSLSEEFPDVVAVQSEDNVGYAAANNFGLSICRHLGAEYFWIVNPDIVIPHGYYKDLLGHVQRWPEHDFFGCTIVSAYEPNKVLFCGGEVRLDQGARPGHLHMGGDLTDLPSESFECDYLTGANIFGRTRSLERVGYMPEEYFLYFEETHWFLEMFFNGGAQKPLVVPSLIAKNYKRSEHGNLPSKYYMYYFVRNSLIFGYNFARGDRTACEVEARKFSDSWLKKIAARAPQLLPEFKALVERAFADGAQGRTGRVVI